MKSRFGEFLQRNEQNEEAKEIIDAEKNEIALYEKYNTYYSYGVYVAKKLES